MKKAWKPISVLIVFCLILITSIVYARTSVVTSQATTVPQNAHSGVNTSRCAKCKKLINITKHAVTHATTAAASDNYLYGVAAFSTTNVWAVGENYSYTTGIDKLIIEYWNGQQWSIVAGSTPGASSFLAGVAAVSANDVWAVGEYDPTATASGQTLIEHWNGTAWSVVPSPNVGSGYNSLSGITALSTNNVWVVGESILGTVTSALIEHWNGTSWSIVSSPDPGTIITSLASITAVSANSIWAVGTYSSKSMNSTDLLSLVEYWNGTRWEVVPSPISSGVRNYLFAVAAISGDNVFSGGDFAERWDGATWNMTNNLTSYVAFGLTSIPGTTKVWSVGGGSSGTETAYWNGTQWEAVSNPNSSVSGELNGVTAISANDVWTVGEAYDAGNNGSTLALHWDGGAWSAISIPNP